MSTAIGATGRRRGLVVSTPTVVLLVAAAAAWLGTIAWARDMGMGAMPGTMGMDLVAFVVMWGLMMAAMMLPSVWPFVLMYSRTVQDQRTPRLTALATGYVLAWTATGFVAFGLAWTFGQLAEEVPTAARATAVVTFVAVGLYQLTPLKFRCLSHCRSPVSHLLHYTSFRGPLRDLKAGAHHGWFCLGCCWALMVLMVAFGVMNLWAMVGLAAVIGIEKTWRHGEWFARSVGVAAIGIGIAVIFFPGLAPGLDPDSTMDMMNMGGQMGS